MKKLKSTDEILDKSFWTDEWDGTGDEIADVLNQDRNQAYTSLVEGIKAQVKDINGESSVFDDFATDILENVVKPLYGKELTMSTNKINIEAVNARAREEETPMTKILSVEEVVDNFGKQFDELKMKPSKKSMPGLERELLKDFMRKALTAEREAGREEERANIPVSFLRQWINEDMKQPHQELVTNEDIMRFINIGYGK